MRASTRGREAGKKRRKESRMTAVKPPYERNSREVRSVRCNAGVALEMEERKKKERESERKREVVEEV